MKRELNVVVSGRSASGKTTVARAIAETLAALGIEAEVLPAPDGDDTPRARWPTRRHLLP